MGSAANSKEGSVGLDGAGESLGNFASTRANPMALDIPVNATGTRPGSGPDKRDLFSEEANTVLVFPDGAVIRLCAAVVSGQLIFLTNKQTGTEVVCQVVGKRVYRPTSCYVELKFTEQIEGFWGVTFPPIEEETHSAPPLEAPKESTAESVTESVQSAEATEDSAAPAGPPPTGPELEELREEVEALRRQLRELRRAEASARTVASMAEPPGFEPAPPAATVAQNTAPPNAQRTSEAIWPVSQPAPVAPVVPIVEAPVVARSSHVAMSLPNREAEKIDPEQEVLDQLLPQPELDFSKIPVAGKDRDPNDPYSIYKPARAKLGKWTLGVLVVLLVGAVGVGAWRLGFVPKLPNFAKKAAPSVTKAKQVAPAKSQELPKTVSPPNTPSETATLVAASAPIASNTTSVGNVGASTATTNLAAGKPVDATVAGESGKKSVEKVPTEKAATSPATVTKRVDAAQKNSAKAVGKKRDTGAAEPTATEVAPVPEDGPLVPAKMLKSVSPIYPPDAMRSFITGDVTIKAEVDAKGEIGNMEVVSGPAALRSAALEALKQYQYEPATRGGKGVASQVKVTIKFWFDP